MNMAVLASTYTRPKWSLTEDSARACFVLANGLPSGYAGSVKGLKVALKYYREFVPAGTFESFLAVNGIELVG